MRSENALPSPVFARSLTAGLVPLGFLLASSAVAGACDHPYFANSGTFTYRTTAAGQVLTSTSTVKLSGNTITVRGEAAGQAYTVVYDCKGGQISMKAGGQQQASLALSSVPPASKWQVGLTWKSDAVIANMNAHTTNRIVGSEQITTPAGTFQTLKVQSTTSMDLSKMFKGAKVPPEMASSMKDVQTTAWYARGVGVVKQISPNSSLELIKISR